MREPAELTLGLLLQEARTALRTGAMVTPDLDARLLVAGMLGMDATSLLTRADDPVAAGEVTKVREAIGERLGGKPVHRILGEREFYGHRLMLSLETLEPRPDTEILVDAVLPFVRACVAGSGGCSLADLGVGTGAVGLAILSEVAEARCFGVDCSADAVATAMANATALGLAGRYTAVAGDWLAGVDEHFDLIVSNPPYITSSDIALLSPEVRLHDPMAALDGGADGLEAYRAIAGQAGARLKRHGRVAVEIGAGQGRDVESIFHDAGHRVVSMHTDLSGIERVLVFNQG